MTATQGNHSIDQASALYMAFELGVAWWKLAFSAGLGQKPRFRTVRAGDLAALQQEITRAKKRFGLPDDAQVVSCYEAGRDGFWLHRYLASQGVANLVVDSSSIEVKRRKRQAKSDRLDAGKLLAMLIRHAMGEKKAWSVVNVPGVQDEDDRQLHRELESLKRERTRHTNRIGSLLATYGLTVGKADDQLPQRLRALRMWDGSPLPLRLRQRLQRECRRLKLVEQQISQVDRQRSRLIRESKCPKVVQVRQLKELCSIGDNSAWLWVMEVFGWRRIRNRRELGSLCGLTPTPYQSGDGDHEQGISKAGNRRVRAMAVEIAWCWLRWQPQSELSRWYEKRFAGGGKRMRRIGIVAMARKLLVQLWRYLEHGELPPGAVLKAAA
jgi:transposase